MTNENFLNKTKNKKISIGKNKSDLQSFIAPNVGKKSLVEIAGLSSRDLDPTKRINGATLTGLSLEYLNPAKRINGLANLTGLSPEYLDPSKRINGLATLTGLSPEYLDPTKRINGATLTGLSPEYLNPTKRINGLANLTGLSPEYLDPAKRINGLATLTRLSSEYLDPTKRINGLATFTGLSSEYLDPAKRVKGLATLTGITAKNNVINILNSSPKTTLTMDLLTNVEDLTKSINLSFKEGSLESLISVDRLTRLSDNFKLVKKDDSAETLISNTESGSEIPLSLAHTTLSILDVFDNLTENQIVDFYHHISKFPMLGLSHKVGRKIFKVIPDISLKEITNVTLYHCRQRTNRDMIFNENELFEAPYGTSNHGRFNLIGEGFLYTNNSIEGALTEVRYEPGKKTDGIKWTFSHKIKILDLVDQRCPLIDICSTHANNEGKIEPAYFIPNFLASCCRYYNIQGIRYESFRERGTINYVFFDYAKSWFNRVSTYVYD